MDEDRLLSRLECLEDQLSIFVKVSVVQSSPYKWIFKSKCVFVCGCYTPKYFYLYITVNNQQTDAA